MNYTFHLGQLYPDRIGHQLKIGMLQIKHDLGLVIPHLTQPERKALRAFVDPEGVASQELSKGLLMYFKPYLEKTLVPGFVRLSAPWHESAIQVRSCSSRNCQKHTCSALIPNIQASVNLLCSDGV